MGPPPGGMKIGGGIIALGGADTGGGTGVVGGINTAGTGSGGSKMGGELGNRGSSAKWVSTGASKVSGGGSCTQVGILGIDEILLPQRLRA